MKTTWSIGIIFILAGIAGAAVMLAVFAYREYTIRYEISAATYQSRFARSVRILSFDISTRTVQAQVLGAPQVVDGLITFTVSENTRLERRTPIVEGGILVGLEAPLPAETSELTAGKLAFVRLTVSDDQRLYAAYILLDDPLSMSQ